MRSGLTSCSMPASPGNSACSASVARSSSAIAPVTAGAVTSSALRTTLERVGLLRERGLEVVELLDDREVLRAASPSPGCPCPCAAPGAASASSSAVVVTAHSSGRFMTRSTRRDQRPSCADPALEAVRGRGRGPCRPCRRCSDSSAGSTVSEPSIATPTTAMVPVANEVNVAAPPKYMPGHRDHHGRRRRRARRGPTSPPRPRSPRRCPPGRALLADAAQVEQRVVDADGEADEQDHVADRRRRPAQLAERADEAERPERRR